MKYINLICLVFIFLVSCENKSESNQQQAIPSAANPLFGPIDSSARSNTGSAVALNPKHGEPGHRCDIAEGAPLPTAATNTGIQTTINPAPAPTIIPSNAEAKKDAPVSNTAGLNPKHGEPGHRCDIAVGAPLNSKPTQ